MQEKGPRRAPGCPEVWAGKGKRGPGSFSAVQDHKYFDSADWALSKQLPAGGTVQQQENGQRLAPKMEPSQFPPRRASQLGEGQ